MSTHDDDAGPAAGSDGAGLVPGSDHAELAAGSQDPLRRAVAVMDRLYSDGGCPWDREQTHESLVRYLLEESYELAESIEAGDRAGMREELGDVLLQVLFHARIASEEPEPFSIDDVAGDLADKLVRRHPHVFARPGPVADLHAQWDALKQEEKQRASVLEGIPLNQSALSRAQKVISRARRAGLDVAGEPPGSKPRATGGGPRPAAAPDAATEIGARLLELVRSADAAGVDAEGALRHVARTLEARVVAAESGQPR